MDWAVIKKNWMLLDFVVNKLILDLSISPEKNRSQANNLWSLDWLILWECLVRDWMRYMKDTRCLGLWNNVVFLDLCRDHKGDSQERTRMVVRRYLNGPFNTAYGEGVCLWCSGRTFPLTIATNQTSHFIFLFWKLVHFSNFPAISYHFQQYFSDIVGRKRPTCRKSLTNFIT